jgi:hypothetical protein
MWTAVQDLEEEDYRSMTFVEDFWLMLLRRRSKPQIPPPSAFFNKEWTTIDGGTLAQTTFYFDPSRNHGLGLPDLISDPGGQEPSRKDDLLRHFIQTPCNECLCSISTTAYRYFLVVKVETLLKLVQERKVKICSGRNGVPMGPWLCTVYIQMSESGFPAPGYLVCTRASLGKYRWICTTLIHERPQGTRNL